MKFPLNKRPLVSVIIPCRNEQATIVQVLQAISQQSYPTENIEVLIVDGLSTDGTREKIQEFVSGSVKLPVKVIDNPRQTIPSALNVGVSAAACEIILRLDAHSIPNSTYVERSVEDLEAGKGDNVGGVWRIKPGNEGWVARSIALAASNRLGVGDALYRVGREEGPVDTVPFGAFYQRTVLKVGGFNETLLTNEDYEFNARIRKAGGVVWLDPAIQSEYIARRNWRELGQQYWRYGFWKNRMLRIHPETLRWRQALPPIFLIFLCILLVLSIGSEYARITLALVCGFYVLCLFVASIRSAASKNDMRLILGIPISIATMHFAWGAGFLASFVVNPKSGGKP